MRSNIFRSESVSGPLAAGALAAVGASACCFGPLALATLGAGGAWVARLRLLEPLQPVLIGLVLIFLGLAFYRLHVRPRKCAPDEGCAAPAVRRRQRATFWIVTIAALAMLAFPLYAPLLY